MPKDKNPYLKAKQQSPGPVMARLPMFDFDTGHDMEEQLLPYEACIARIPSTDPKFLHTHAVAFVYKDGAEKVYSVGLTQHHGEFKDTPEVRAILHPKKKAKKKSVKKKAVKK